MHVGNPNEEQGSNGRLAHLFTRIKNNWDSMSSKDRDTILVLGLVTIALLWIYVINPAIIWIQKIFSLFKLH